jgi:hypothetical protein
MIRTCSCSSATEFIITKLSPADEMPRAECWETLVLKQTFYAKPPVHSCLVRIGIEVDDLMTLQLNSVDSVPVHTLHLDSYPAERYTCSNATMVTNCFILSTHGRKEENAVPVPRTLC